MVPWGLQEGDFEKVSEKHLPVLVYVLYVLEYVDNVRSDIVISCAWQ